MCTFRKKKVFKLYDWIHECSRSTRIINTKKSKKMKMDKSIGTNHKALSAKEHICSCSYFPRSDCQGPY